MNCDVRDLLAADPGFFERVLMNGDDARVVEHVGGVERLLLAGDRR